MLATLNTTMANIETFTKQHYAALHWRGEMHHQFDDGLDYDGVATLNISKNELTNLVFDPKNGKYFDPRKPKLSIKWFTNEAIRTHF